ncbi:transmembrane protein 177-like [Dysidea avara]|uniref:transmembrane protein 177-like n=1 Tax=Dysidea avara TaxID=196820 RepID=UPI0033202F3A
MAGRLGRTVGIAVTGVFCISAIPHVIPGTFKRLFRTKDTPVPPELVDHVHEIARAMHIQNPDRIKVFTTTHFSCFNGGATWLPGGAFIGLSRTLLYSSEEDIKTSGITLYGKPIDWDSKDGATLQRCFLQSQNQIDFCIAHELAHIKSSDFVMSTLLLPGTVLTSYAVLRLVSPYLSAKQSKLAAPVAFGVGMLIYLQLQTSLNYFIEHKADRIAAQIDRRFVDGGIEMMRKGMQLNSILKTELGRSKMPFGLGSSHPRFSARLRRLQKLVT